MTQLSYAAAGVDIDAGDELVERIKPLANCTISPQDSFRSLHGYFHF